MGHKEGDRAVLDALREKRPPFSPDAVVEDFAEKLAGWLRSAGELTPPYGIELVRMAVEEPPRPLAPDLDTFARLCRDLEDVPELAGPLAAALGSASYL